MTLPNDSTRAGPLNHVGIACFNLEESVRQFRELFDSPEPHIVASDELGVRGAFIHQGETLIELLEPLRDDVPIAKFLKNRGEGIHHIAFTVPDVDAKLKQLLDMGIPMLDQVPRSGLGGRIAFTQPSATHGVLIEIITPYPGH